MFSLREDSDCIFTKGKIAYFSTYEKVSKSYCLQPSGCKPSNATIRLHRTAYNKKSQQICIQLSLIWKGTIGIYVEEISMCFIPCLIVITVCLKVAFIKRWVKENNP